MTDQLRIMAVGEIARALGVGSNRVHQIIRNNPTFPPHAAELSVGKIWRTEAIEKWIVEHRPDRAKEIGK